MRSPPGPVHHHLDITAAALRANQPAAPLRHWRLGTKPASLLRWVGFAPVTTCFTLDDKPEVGSGVAAERHWWAAVGFHFAIGDGVVLFSEGGLYRHETARINASNLAFWLGAITRQRRLKITRQSMVIFCRSRLLKTSASITARDFAVRAFDTFRCDPA
jgi:hypothetical protein